MDYALKSEIFMVFYYRTDESDIVLSKINGRHIYDWKLKIRENKEMKLIQNVQRYSGKNMIK